MGGSGSGREPKQTTYVRMAGVEGVTRSERATWITMGAVLYTPFCPYEGQRVGMRYLAAECRYTTRWKDGVRDLVRELCCAVHHFRVRLSPWQPMVESR